MSERQEQKNPNQARRLEPQRVAEDRGEAEIQGVNGRQEDLRLLLNETRDERRRRARLSHRRAGETSIFLSQYMFICRINVWDFFHFYHHWSKWPHFRGWVFQAPLLHFSAIFDASHIIVNCKRWRFLQCTFHVLSWYRQKYLKLNI